MPIPRTLNVQQLVIDADLSPVECFRCGICCQRYQPKVTSWDINAIAEYLGVTKNDFISRYVQRVPLKEGFLLRRYGKSCVFLSPGGRDKRAECTIYEVRPRVCRDWIAGLSRPECREGLNKGIDNGNKR